MDKNTTKGIQAIIIVAFLFYGLFIHEIRIIILSIIWLYVDYCQYKAENDDLN